MKKMYLCAAVVGAIVPYYFFFQFVQVNGLSLLDFLSAMFANPAVAGMSADLFLSSFVFWGFMFYQQKKSQGPKPWLFVALNLVIGLSCALPAYLYAQQKSSEKNT
jgi:hypothetical protein